MKAIYTYAALALSSISFGQQLFIVNSDNKFGVVNENGLKSSPNTSMTNLITSASWAKVGLDNLYGFVDKTGKNSRA
jgi:hypothetical protein